MKRRNDDDLSVGEDSFLDTIANLVGILIILVVVVGAKTKIEAEAYGRNLAQSDHSQTLEQPLEQALALERSLEDQAIALQQYELESQYRRLERNALLERVVLARNQAQERLGQLDQQQRDSVEQEQLLAKLQSELDRVIHQAGETQAADRPEVILEHLPTPMAHTVFQKELHVMLRGGCVTVIPWDRLVELLKQQVPLAAQRQASRGVLEDTLGPISGFLMRFRMRAIPGGFELDRFELEPTDAVHAEPLADALQDSSRLALELASRKPRETVVTVWVYPDSFDGFRSLKAHLFSEGFLSAARPLPDSVRIGASPHGTRSNAQ
ncbi:MAG: hypothetical protein KF752_15190 [Pirellulaceae bacterium]|nr:hypothetical protein [Pirellulaceae bacterium]